MSAKQTTVFGPPGCGKTTRLVALLEEQVAEGLDPRRAAYTTFTRVAADVAKGRAAEATGADDDDLRWFGTLHALCGRLLDFDWRNRLLADTTEKGRLLLKDFGKTEGFLFDWNTDMDQEADAFTGEGPEGNQLLSWYQWGRQCALPLDESISRWRALSTSTLIPERMRRFAQTYETFKGDTKHSDFTDILVRADAGALVPPVDALWLDEAQDLSPLQWHILDRWREVIPTVFIGGDDDQAIYAWQGADARLFLNRTREGAITTLSQSYRLPRTSWSVTTWLSRRIAERQAKPFAPMAAEGQVRERPLFRIPFTEEGSWFVLARNTFLLRDVRRMLEHTGIPYRSRRGYDPVRLYYPAARAITALARNQSVTRDDLAGLVRRLEATRDYDPYLARRLSPHRVRELPLTITQRDLLDLGFTEAFRDRLSHEPVPVRMLSFISARGWRDDRTWTYLVKLQSAYGDGVFSREPAITLSTIHGVKGDEADHVVLLSDMARASLRTLDTDPDSEHRVWYVGVSRARQNLYLVPPMTEVSYEPLTDGRWRGALEQVTAQ